MGKPIQRLIAIHCLIAAVVLAVFLCAPQRTSAGSLSTSVVGMFPKQVGEFAYADLKSARKFPWFP